MKKEVFTILKNKNKHIPSGYTKHHRKPEKLGGSGAERNISIVLRPKHKAWHTLFDSFDVTKTMELFEEYWQLFGSDPKPDSEKQRIREWVRAKESRINKLKAWRCLFKNLALEEVVEEINSTWIDPDYMLVIATVQVSKVALATRYRKSR